MGVPAFEVGYTSATTGRGDHEVHKGHVVALEEKKLKFYKPEQVYIMKHYIIIIIIFICTVNEIDSNVSLGPYIT
jgi:hypothetical protein